MAFAHYANFLLTVIKLILFFFASSGSFWNDFSWPLSFFKLFFYSWSLAAVLFSRADIQSLSSVNPWHILSMEILISCICLDLHHGFHSFPILGLQMVPIVFLSPSICLYVSTLMLSFWLSFHFLPETFFFYSLIHFFSLLLQSFQKDSWGDL